MARSKHNKSGLLPALYSQLSPDEQQKIRVQMKEYNETTRYAPFFEVEQFYQRVVRGIRT